jgi:hypothetical protein
MQNTTIINRKIEKTEGPYSRETSLGTAKELSAAEAEARGEGIGWLTGDGGVITIVCTGLCETTGGASGREIKLMLRISSMPFFASPARAFVNTKTTSFTKRGFLA